jgi:SEC-C motif-containing protein
MYDLCCAPYHEKIKFPESAEKLMRSRYSAYALDLPDYIIETTHKKSPLYETNREKWVESIHAFSHNTLFEDLIIEEADETTVTFYAILSSFGKDISFREKSYFKKQNGKWCYFDRIRL